MLDVVTSNRFDVLLKIGQYGPIQMNYRDKILRLFFRKTSPVDPLQNTLTKLSQLPWDNTKIASSQALTLLQRGWQELNSYNPKRNSYKQSLKEFFRGQLYCFQAACAIINENKTHPQIVFDYISKAKDSFLASNKIYINDTSVSAIKLLDSEGQCFCLDIGDNFI